MWIEGNYVKAFLGSCKGVALEERGEGDPHVCLVILTEDDEHWFPSKNGFSSFWTDDLIEQLQAAKQWMEENCDSDDGCGWKFRATPGNSDK